MSTATLDRPNMAEESDGYEHVVCHLNDTWRVIRCSASIQWILQRRLGDLERVVARWKSVAYHRSRDTLLEAVARRCGEVTEAGLRALHDLPEWVTP